MGGFGSGNYTRLAPRHSRVEEVRSFDLTILRRYGCLTGKPRVWQWRRPDRPALDIGIVSCDWGVRLLWKRNGKWEENRILYGSSAVSFGVRRWFCCPHCRGNCRILYWTDPAVMLCRKCADLRYASQSEERHWRADRRADTIRRRLGATDRGRHEFPPKPRKMRRTTYLKLFEQHNDLVERWSAGMTATFAVMEKRAAKSIARFRHRQSD